MAKYTDAAHTLRAAIGEIWIVSPVITAVLNRKDLSDYEQRKLRELNTLLAGLHRASYEIDDVQFSGINPFHKEPVPEDPDEAAKEAIYERS